MCFFCRAHPERRVGRHRQDDRDARPWRPRLRRVGLLLQERGARRGRLEPAHDRIRECSSRADPGRMYVLYCSTTSVGGERGIKDIIRLGVRSRREVWFLSVLESGRRLEGADPAAFYA